MLGPYWTTFGLQLPVIVPTAILRLTIPLNLTPNLTRYPALHRLEQRRWLIAEWRSSETGREAKFYTLTRAGHRQLAVEKASWTRLSSAVQLIFDAGQ
jgi:hypothetical protein